MEGFNKGDSLWGARENGGFYDPSKKPSEQGDFPEDWGDRFEGVPDELMTSVNLLGEDVRALKGEAGSVVVGLSANLAKTPEEIKALSLLSGVGIVTTSSYRSEEFQASEGKGGNLGFVNSEDVTSDEATASSVFTNETDSAVNHFAVHSPELDEDFLKKLGDVQGELLNNGQLLIVSVMGSAWDGEETTQEAYLADWKLLIEKMETAGVRNVELNFANPHKAAGLGACEGSQFKLPGKAAAILDACNSVKPEWMNIGVELRHIHQKDNPEFLDVDAVSELMEAIAGKVAFVVGINTDPKEIKDKEGDAYFGEARANAGVSGAAIHKKALAWTEAVVAWRDENGYEWPVFATGGARDTKSIQAFVDAGADAVLATTGAFNDPEMYAKYATDSV